MTNPPEEPERPAEQVPADAPSTAVGVPGAVVGVRTPGGLPAVDRGSAVSGVVGGGYLPAPRGMRVSRPARNPRWLIDQLPVGMVQSDFFVRFVALFQELASTLLDDADLVEHVPDVTVTPTQMLQLLAGWIGVDAVDESLPEQLQRLIVRSSAKSLAHRGTVRGLREFVEMLSGGPAEVLDGGGVWREGDAPSDVAWVRVTVAGTGHLSDDEFVAMVRDEVPAHVRIELWVGTRCVLSTVEEDR
jgi:phage tail-like protein